MLNASHGSKMFQIALHLLCMPYKLISIALLFESEWEIRSEFTEVGHVEEVLETRVHLEPGYHYRCAVKLCHTDGCSLVN